MGVLKTPFAALCLWIGLAAAVSAAVPDAPRDRAQVFAACLGRYSAETQHRWLISESPDRMQAHRALFELMLDGVAARSGLGGPAIMDMRVRAKMAQARLLRTARFHTDPKRRRRAAAAARRALRPCDALLLG